MLDKIAGRTATWIAKSKGAQNLFKCISDNASQVSVHTANGVNFVARPITIMATTKPQNLLDGAYCASSSVASGISETFTAVTMLKPFNKALEKSTSELQASGFFKSIAKDVNITEKEAQETLVSALGRIFLIGLVPIASMCKFFLHPPLANKTKDVTEKIKTKLNKGGKLNVVA